jgi:hypothetical protein
MAVGRLFRPHELAFRTQYAELKERVGGESQLLPGTPGSLSLRTGTGLPYWYRVFYSVPNLQAETLVGREDDTEARQTMKQRIDFSAWTSQQVSSLRKLGFQVGDKAVARVLVELYNKGAFEAGLVLVGTLGYMAWLNELGAIAISARTQDIDLARRQALKLAAPLPLLQTMKQTGLPFVAVPGFPSSAPSTTLKLRGIQSLRIDVLAPGKTLGAVIPVPEMEWTAQAIPHYDYLLEVPEHGAMLAGGHCIPVRLPQAARMVWHKLYSSTSRLGFPEKAAKDRGQALVLAALLVESDAQALLEAFAVAPAALRKKIKPLRSSLLAELEAYPELQVVLQDCLG